MTQTSQPYPATLNVAAGGLQLREPKRQDGYPIHQLIDSCPPLDKNSIYTYLLLSEHFAQTCVVAEINKKIKGFVSAYLHPDKEDVLFVWQVAVHEEARKMGLAQAMLNNLLERPALKHVRFIETTVGPTNKSSRRMFKSLANNLDASINERELFDAGLFGNQEHEDEPLIKIGPFQRTEAVA